MIAPGRILHWVRTRGAGALLRAAGRRLFRTRARAYRVARPYVAGRRGLEIGGPTSMFASGHLLPLYRDAASLDNVNYATETVWEGTLDEGGSFRPEDLARPGTQYVREGTDLHGLDDAAYDFVLSSHTLEHIANPIAALREWRRVLAPDGLLVLVLPHRDATFDRNRPVTPLAHMEEDFRNEVGEDDLTHLDEVLRLHDLTLDPDAGDRASFAARCRENARYRCLHHHTFTTESAARLVARSGYALLHLEARHPFHIIVLARRTDAAPDSTSLFSPEAEWRAKSPFPSDAASAPSAAEK